MLSTVNMLKLAEVCKPFFQTLRQFSKVFNFKADYPELYKHVDESSKYLFNNPWVGSKQIVKWRCDKGPDHVWDATLESRIQSYKRNHKCIF